MKILKSSSRKRAGVMLAGVTVSQALSPQGVKAPRVCACACACVCVRVRKMQSQGSEEAARGRRGLSLPRGQCKGDSGKHSLKGKPRVCCDKAKRGLQQRPSGRQTALKGSGRRRVGAEAGT